MSEEECDVKQKKLTDKELKEGILCGGEQMELIFPTTIVRLDIDPNLIESEDDKYLLYSTDADEYYRQTKTIADDMVDGDSYVDLHFTGIRHDLRYTLEVDPGAEGESYPVYIDELLK